ncbi:MAG TPA: LuxR C-terminal-related transcriptional regulator [Trebonia sp.]|nr:LuxR C-terminal-related transcriptional regulator [Trebonia sp.]
MARAEPGGVTGGWAPPTSFVGREQEAGEIVRLLDESRLVTVTGPGGVGKTRLAVEVARAAAAQFPDGAFFVGLGAVTDPAQVAGEVAAAVGVAESRGQPARTVLAQALAPRLLLLVLDNCEHVLDAVAGLCGELLKAADDVRILATSREQLGVTGEAWYRLAPLGLPGSDNPAEVSRSEAVTLFAERARRADPRFALSPEHAPLAARVVAALDGMPLAIELAAARVEALGLAGLADRIDDMLRLLQGRGEPAAARHRSLAAVADWSYQLLSEPERQVFRRLAAFPGPFTLEAAEAVAGSDAGAVVLRLVDCSLLTPPQPGPDGRMRYRMLQTLRAYGLDLLTDADEERQAMAALAGFALSLADQAAAGLRTSDHDREVAALRWLDAEDGTLSAALGWALENDPGPALHLATILALWRLQRGRMTEGYTQLAAAVAQATPGSQAWVRAQYWLGYLSHFSGDYARSLAHHTAGYEAAAGSPLSEGVILGLIGQATAEANLGRLAEAAEAARRALTLARQADDRAFETRVLTLLGLIAYYGQDDQEAVDWIRQARASLTPAIPGFVARRCLVISTVVLAGAGNLEAASQACADGLAWSREAGDLQDLTNLLMERAHIASLAGKPAETGVHLREAIEVALRIGDVTSLRNCILVCGYLCARTGRWAEAVTFWAAHTAYVTRAGSPANQSREHALRQEWIRRVEAALTPGQVREARERGTRMTMAAAAELAIMLTASAGAEPPTATTELTGRERELVTLVAQGHTNAQIAAELFISVRTVGSHLDRIRDKTGYRRRADLTRLALREGLV